MDSENKKFKIEEQEEEIEAEPNIEWTWREIIVGPGSSKQTEFQLSTKTNNYKIKIPLFIINGTWKGPLFVLAAGINCFDMTIDSTCCDVFEIMSRYCHNLKGTIVIFPNLKALGDVFEKINPKSEEDTAFVDIICGELKPSYFMELSSSPLYSCTPFIRIAKEENYFLLSKLNLFIIDENNNSILEEILFYKTISETLDKCISFSLEIGSKCAKNGIDVRSKFVSTITCLTCINFEMNGQTIPKIVKTQNTLSYTFPDFLSPNLRVPFKSLCPTMTPNINSNNSSTIYNLESAFVSNEKFFSEDFLGSSTLIPLILEGNYFNQENPIIKIRNQKGKWSELKFDQSGIVLGYRRDLLVSGSGVPLVLLGLRK